LTKAEAVSVAQLLGHLGVGVEPDVRFGPVALSDGPAVLFRTGHREVCAPTANYRAATALLHLAVVVGLADGKVVPAEYEHMAAHLETALGLSDPEKLRLGAHLRWLVAARPTASGTKKRLDAIGFDDRRRIAGFLLTVATADGIVHPAEVTTLTKIYAMLGLEPSDVYTQLHESAAASMPTRPPRPATEPIVVRPAGAAARGFTIAGPTVDEERRQQPTGFAHGALSLDQSLIDEKIAEGAQVAAMLGSIFTDDEPTPSTMAQPGPSAAVSKTPRALTTEMLSVAGLDDAHSRLLRDLTTAPTWSSGDYERLATQLGLLPAGALELLNETALEITGDLVVEGDEELIINVDVFQEMLG
jgi:uncharacterized tellurite resistance protein B-like protein